MILLDDNIYPGCMGFVFGKNLNRDRPELYSTTVEYTSSFKKNAVMYFIRFMVIGTLLQRLQ